MLDKKEHSKYVLINFQGEDMIKDMLSTIDNFERAIKLDDNDLTDELSKFLAGFKMIYCHLVETLEKYEVKAIDGINKEFDLHSLSVAVNNGFSQSKKRKNSIFYIQSMISYAILSLLNNEKVRAVKTLLLSVKLILSEKVQLSHEGIKQLLFILKEKCVPLYAVVELAYTMQMEYGFYSKVALYDVDLGKMSWESIVDQVNELYMIRFKNKKIYNVDIEDVKIFL